MKTVVIGAGGHAKVLLDILTFNDTIQIIGLTDADSERTGEHILGFPILGSDEILPRLRAEGVEGAIIGVGSVKDASIRCRLFDQAQAMNFCLINAIHPDATIAKSAQLGYGVAVMAQAAINPDTIIGNNVIINTGAQLDHDCRVGDHAHIAPGAHIAGGVHIDNCAHIGIAATILQTLSIGARSVVGAGSVVIDDVPPDVIVAGIPAYPIKTKDK